MVAKPEVQPELLRQLRTGRGFKIERPWERCPDLAVPVVDGALRRAYACGVKVRDVLRLLRRNAGLLRRTRGSHRQYGHSELPGLVTVAGRDNDDLAPGTLGSILKQAGPKP